MKSPDSSDEEEVEGEQGSSEGVDLYRLITEWIAGTAAAFGAISCYYLHLFANNEEFAFFGRVFRKLAAKFCGISTKFFRNVEQNAFVIHSH